MYLNECRKTLAMTCGVKVLDVTVWKMLCRAGFTIKKVWWKKSCPKYLDSFSNYLQVTHITIGHSAEKHSEYIARISGYQPDQLVFVDESSVDHRTIYRGSAWSFWGTQAQHKAFLCAEMVWMSHIFTAIWESYIIWRFSVLPALSLNGIIHCEIIEGSYCDE